MTNGKQVAALTFAKTMLNSMLINQKNKCKIFGHKPDFTIIKMDAYQEYHDTLCINCGSHMFLPIQGCTGTKEWVTISEAHSDSLYATAIPFLYEYPNDPIK